MKKCILEKLGLTERDFEPSQSSEERINDLEEALMALTEVMLEVDGDD